LLFGPFWAGTLSAKVPGHLQKEQTMAFHPSFFFHPKPKTAVPKPQTEKPGKTA
jgi:hypothetical protein